MSAGFRSGLRAREGDRVRAEIRAGAPSEGSGGPAVLDRFLSWDGLAAMLARGLSGKDSDAPLFGAPFRSQPLGGGGRLLGAPTP